MKVSVLITAYKEPRTIAKAIDAFLNQKIDFEEIVVVCPDEETTSVVYEYASKYPFVKHVKDEQKGKPTALNLGLKAIHSDVVVLSDGDVMVGEDAIDSMVDYFRDENVGAVTGRPISINGRNTLLGYWSHLLTDAFHDMRSVRDKSNEFLLCSGYLFAFRTDLIKTVPEDALAEDAVISHMIAEMGYQIRYSSGSTVYVKYPTNYKDWLTQKIRSAGGYAQDYIRNSPLNMRSAKLEFLQGAKRALSYPNNVHEFIWTLLLFAARLHLWFLVWLNVRFSKKSFSSIWKRVESTK